MPTPRKAGEDRDKFIQRCMSEIYDEFPDNAQRYAVCISYADKTTQSMKKDELFVLVPRKSENRGQFLIRCSRNSKIKSQFGDLKERMVFCLTSFNEYYKYWSKMEDNFGEVPKNTALGDCIASKKAQGLDYKEAYARCASKVVVPNTPIVMEDNLIIEPVEFSDMSIDFDDTLSTERGQKLAKNLMEQGNTLHIITRRQETDSEEVYKIADELGIPRDAIHFTNGKLKWEMIKKLGIQTHIDNNPDEIKAIEENLDDVEAVKFGLEDACWEGYEPYGLKPGPDGRLVPNCVPIKD